MGVRIKSGTTDLYVAILGILLAGAAYVPVDADDPDERARVGVRRVRCRGGHRERAASWRRPAPERVRTPSERAGPDARGRRVGDLHVRLDRTPKGVAVTHRNAAAFVDAESGCSSRPTRSDPTTG